MALVVENLPANAGDARGAGLIPELGTSPGGGNGNPLQYSYLENPMDRGAWWAAVCGVTELDMTERISVCLSKIILKSHSEFNFGRAQLLHEKHICLSNSTLCIKPSNFPLLIHSFIQLFTHLFNNICRMPGIAGHYCENTH